MKRRTTAQYLDCSGIIELFSSLLDGDCCDELEQELTIHIEKCPVCGCYFRTFEKTIYLCRSIKEYDYFKVPEHIHNEFWHFLREEITVNKRRKK